jgi:opacity protein-like surface antigen
MKSSRMKTGWIALLSCLAVAAAVHAADVVGAWVGNWEGGGAGGTFNITLSKNGDALAGKVDVGQDTGDYSAPFTSASLDGAKFKARYDYPPEPQAEIVLEGTFEGANASGSWSMVQKGGSDSFAAGTWTVKKK